MVQSSHILLLVLTCLLVVGGDIVEDAVGSVKDTYDTAKDAVKGNDTSVVVNPKQPEEFPGNGTNLGFYDRSNLEEEDWKSSYNKQSPDKMRSQKRDVPYPGIIPEEAAGYHQNEEDLSRTQETGNVMCQKCRIEKSLDNNIISISDLVTETVEASGRCQGYECTNGEDWCLVTYYRRRAFDDDPERKFEVHSCGSETIKKGDNVCRDILNGDDHNIVEDCHTKRSDASSVYTIYLSIATSILFLYLGQ